MQSNSVGDVLLDFVVPTTSTEFMDDAHVNQHPGPETVTVIIV